MDSLLAIRRAVSLAGAEKIVQSLPIGLNTPMDGAGCDSSQYPSFSKDPMAVHGLSGGEVILMPFQMHISHLLTNT